jgi:hypothetical protein
MLRPFRVRNLLTCIQSYLALVLLVSGDVVAADKGKIAVELNDLQPVDKTCRAIFVLNNLTGKILDKLTFRVVVFDAKMHARLFLSLDVGLLPIRKTRVLRFDLGEGLACKDVGRLVLDDVTSCTGADMGQGDCLSALDLSTRASVPFDF